MSEADKQAESGSGSSRCYRAVERAKNIVRANEWEGDMRVNMTTIIGAGRVLANRVEELEELCGYPSELADMIASALEQVAERG